MHTLLLQFTAEFEHMYVQRKSTRLDFVTQAIHNLRHSAPEVMHVGLGICYSQWTMERMIGILKDKLHLHSNPYANLSRASATQAQTNALKALIPELDFGRSEEGKVPHGGVDIHDGYALLRARDKISRDMTDIEKAALDKYIHDNFEADIVPDGWQIACSAWKEKIRDPANVRKARNVKVVPNGNLGFTKVQFYFILPVSQTEDRYLAMSSNALWSCTHGTEECMAVVNVKDNQSVVAMVPHSTAILGDEWKDQVFVVEAPGLDVAEMGGFFEEEDPDDLED
ncbi:hypothetical protein BDP27DRAFT_1426853 [Rhodocollybia butyracea]|uniref:Uncharacterized protein n=1 Tax=Rhodocollybia butyracea TaxID=206335 RepID=A0A9P5U2J1_9AGAR|nr:hypothetical protein BDP27DRAFT_1426853 [Rhodocollybia butyracea]